MVYEGVYDSGRRQRFWGYPKSEVIRRMAVASGGKPFSVWLGWDCVYRKVRSHRRKNWGNEK